MADTYVSQVFKTGAELDEAPTAALAAKQNAADAEAAKEAIVNMDVEAETGDTASVEKSVDEEGAVTLKFTIPRGEPGPEYELTDEDRTSIAEAVLDALPVYDGEVEDT